MDQINVVGLCGSVRAGSTNLLMLKAAALLAPPGMTVTAIVDGRIAPHFNPDYEAPAVIPRSAGRWRDLVATADGLIVSSPEYAGGIPGTFKNALDWLVGDGRFSGKPVAILSASERSIGARDALRLVLRTMSANLIEEASISLPLLGKGEAEIDKAEHQERIASAVHGFAQVIAELKTPRLARASG
jgi:chromate reductase